jgi:hypothetical protein
MMELAESSCLGMYLVLEGTTMVSDPTLSSSVIIAQC